MGQQTVKTSVKTSTNVLVMMFFHTIAYQKLIAPIMLVPLPVLVKLDSMTPMVTALSANRSMNAPMALIHVTNLLHVPMLTSHVIILVVLLKDLLALVTLVSPVTDKQTVLTLMN